MAQCHRCGDENPDRARFCLACGAQLHATCPSCGEQNPANARFCAACGNALDADVHATPPRELRKTVTVVFCDVTGSTTLGERLDPESLRRVMGRYFDEMRAALERHGGTVEKFIGDAVVAVFGIPAVHEDDALRAVRAAAEMRRARDRLNEELERTWGVRIQARIGVDTGEVVAGDSYAGERFATGDTMNVAARLEQAATGGEILIGEETYRLVRDAVRVEPVELLALKGKSERVPAYRLVDVDLWAAGYTRRLDSPLVGRRDELAQLRAEFDAVLAAREARLVTILGSAGLGKSRLTTEFTSGLDDARVLRGRCLSYGQGVGFWPVQEIVRDAAGISDADSVADARARVAALLPDAADTPLVADRALSAIGLGEGSGVAEETFWGVRRLLEALAADRPLIVVVDDCHWAAPAMLDLLEYVAAWSTSAPIMIVCLARPELLELRPSWSATIALAPLDDAESEALLDHLAGEGELDEALRRRVLRTAEGNPLFLEQLVAFIHDGGDEHLPPSIRALVAARLDRLAQEEREAIERGSVEGKVFHRGAVLHLTPEPARAHVPANLLTLVRKNLIGPDRALFEGDDAFRFSNLVLRDGAYDAMPKQVRAELHEKFAAWLSDVTAGEAQEYDEFVAHHLDVAHGYLGELGPLDERARTLGEQAADAYARAGRLALKRGDITACRYLLERAVRLLPATDPRRLELLPNLSFALRESGDFAESLAVLADAAEHGDERIVARAQIEGATTRVNADPEGSSAEVRSVAEHAIPILERLGDDAGLAKAWKLVALAHWMRCRAEDATVAIERAVECADRAGDRAELIDALGLEAFAVAYGPMPVGAAIARCDEIGQGSRADPSVLTSVYAARGRLAAMAGDFAAAREFAADAKRLYDELGMRVSGLVLAQTTGAIELLAGRLDEAERLLRAAMGELDALGERGFLSTLVAELADVVYRLGRIEEAESLARRAFELGAEDDIATQAGGRAVEAKAAARLGRFADAERLAREAVELAAATDFVSFHGEMHAALGEVLDVSGKPDEASAEYREALELFERKGNTVAAADVRAQLARVAA
jgi:class 3 adenylate cyclase/tetratricopeptide (TPR) repeat protein